MCKFKKIVMRKMRKSAVSCIDILSIQLRRFKRVLDAIKQVEKSPHRNSLIVDW